MSKRILSLDVLGELRRARRIINRIERYLASEEKRARRVHQAPPHPEDVAAARAERRALELPEQG